MENKRCKTCGRLILNEESVTCDRCGKDVHKDCSIKDNGKHYCDMCFVNKTEEIVEEESTYELPDAIRRSYIESYRDCPYKAFNEIVKKTPLPHSSFAQVGIDLHDLFHMSNIGEIKTKEELEKQFNKMFRMYNDEMFENDLKLYKDRTIQQHKDHMMNIAVTSIDSFYGLKPEYNMLPFASEQTLQFSVGSDLPKVSMTMDRVDEDGSMLAISDYKTGHVIVGKKIITDLQPPLYIHGVRTEFGRDVSKFTLLYLAENKRRVYERVTDDVYQCKVNNKVYEISIKAALDEVRLIFQNMKDGKWSIPYNDKSMYFKCKTCQLKAIGKCNGAELEYWKEGNLSW